MQLALQCRMALANLINTKLRSLLAILGILIGTASVVAMVTCGKMVEERALQEFKRLGTNLMAVSFYSQNIGQPSLSLQDMLTITNLIPEINHIAPYISSYVKITGAGKSINGSIVGVTHTLQNILKIKLEKGRFISDLDNYSPFCVIGSAIEKQLQQAGVFSPLGKQIRLGNYYFTVIGVAAPWTDNAFFNQSINHAVLIPLQATYIVSKQARINNLVVYLKDDANIDSVEQTIRRYIESHQRETHLYFHSAKQIIQSMKNQSQIYTIFLGLIGSISLIVGGIGIMNIMLVSVTERRKEIGIHLAVGAKRGDIHSLFLIEAITLSLFGGLLGIVLGITTSAVIAHFAKWQFTIFIAPILIGFSISVIVGIFFGFYPAYQAAKLDPIEALRSE